MSPNATPEAKNTLCYLYSQYRNHMLSGQEVNADNVATDYIQQTTGKYPAIRSFDILSGSANTCISWWKAGGFCMWGYHMGSPGSTDDYNGSMTAVSSINQVLTEGSSLNTTFKQRMDRAAAVFLQLQNANVPMIWRPFHEAGGTWFWWSKEGGTQYVALWKYMFKYMTQTKGLKNLLWLLPYDGSPQASFYPGKDYVDIGGADNYNAAYNYDCMGKLYSSAQSIFGTTMPIALHECGPIVDSDNCQSSKADWVFFSIWTNPFPENDSTPAELKKVYTSSYVVTRDEVPSLQ